MKKTITPFTLTMINVAAIASLRNLPITATYGSHLIFYLALAALFFFVPIALSAAELVSHHPQEGGIYVWVRKAFTKRVGFLAVWLQWIGNIIWYPTILTFIGATVGQLIHPSLPYNAFFIFAMVLVIFWGATWANFRGMEVSGWISTLGVIAGTIFPAGAIILLGLIWWASGQPLQIDMSLSSLIPTRLDSSNLALFGGIALSFVGMEMSEVHASDVPKPQSTFPRAIAISAVVIFAIYALGSLAIAFTIPGQEISLTGGVVDAFNRLLISVGAIWLTPIFALLIVIGVVTGVSTWIIGPSRAILIAAKEGHLPAFLCKRNACGMPANIMIVQGIIVSVLSLILLFMPSVESAFLLLTILASQVYMVMYGLMFAAAYRLRKAKKKKRKDLFVAPALGMWLTFGAIGIVGIFIAGLFPPEGINPIHYEIYLLGGVVISCLLPFLWKDSQGAAPRSVSSKGRAK